MIDERRPEYFQHLWGGFTVAVTLFVVTFGAYTLTKPATPFAPTPTLSRHAPETLAQTAREAFADVELMGKSAFVYDFADDVVLYEQNADAQLPLASLTKLITAYVALQKYTGYETVTFGSGIDPTKELPEGLPPGTHMSLRDAVKISLVGSVNQISEYVATHVAKETSNESLVAGVAHALNLTQTYAKNGTGLDLSQSEAGGYGSARDVARVAHALYVLDREVAESTTHTTYTAHDTAGTLYEVTNTNKFAETIPGLLLSKTGFTDLAGGNLAIIFDAGMGRPVAVVVMGSSKEDRFIDVQKLVERARSYYAVY